MATRHIDHRSEGGQRFPYVPRYVYSDHIVFQPAPLVRRRSSNLQCSLSNTTHNQPPHSRTLPAPPSQDHSLQLTSPDNYGRTSNPPFHIFQTAVAIGRGGKGGGVLSSGRRRRERTPQPPLDPVHAPPAEQVGHLPAHAVVDVDEPVGALARRRQLARVQPRQPAAEAPAGRVRVLPAPVAVPVAEAEERHAVFLWGGVESAIWFALTGFVYLLCCLTFFLWGGVGGRRRESSVRTCL